FAEFRRAKGSKLALVLFLCQIKARMVIALGKFTAGREHFTPCRDLHAARHSHGMPLGSEVLGDDCGGRGFHLRENFSGKCPDACAVAQGGAQPMRARSAAERGNTEHEWKTEAGVNQRVRPSIAHFEFLESGFRKSNDDAIDLFCADAVRFGELEEIIERPTDETARRVDLVA